MLRVRRIVGYFTSPKNLESVAVAESDVGKRLDQYLKRMGVGWPVIHKLLRNKCFFVKDQNQTTLKHPEYRLRAGDVIYYHKNFEIKEQLEMKEEDKGLEPDIPRDRAKHIIEKMLLFQNENVIVLNKEGGYSTQGDQDIGTNLFNILVSYLNNPTVHIVHRIDKASTGVIIFAKNLKSATILQEAINNRNGIHKFYIALSSGTPLQKQDLIDCNIEWSDSKNKAKLSLFSNKSSKQCLTFYKSMECTNNLTTYLVKLISGRKHQIRCHLSKYLETPIINDHHYQGECLDKSPSSIYLHSYCTVFQNEDVINKVFKGKEGENGNGSLKLVDGRLWIKGEIFWERNEPNEALLQQEMERLIGYNPQFKKHKTISY